MAERDRRDHENETSEEEGMGRMIRRALILLAPIIWRKFRERRKRR